MSECRDMNMRHKTVVFLRPLKNGFAAVQNLSFAACEPFFTGYAKLSFCVVYESPDISPACSSTLP